LQHVLDHRNGILAINISKLIIRIILAAKIVQKGIL